MKSPKIRKTIFRIAAKVIAQGHLTFSCTALKYVGANEKEMQFYQSFFQPQDRWINTPWWETSESDKECRIFALLLTAEMIE